MKKGSKVLFAYFSVLIMVVGFFLPNFSYIVNASEVKPGDALLKGATSAFTNVEDNTLYLGMEENTSSRVEVNSLNYIVEGCTVVNSSVVSATLNDDGISCTIDSLGYGKTEVLFDIKNINSGSNKIEVLSVDVEFEDYFNYYYNKIPDTMRYSQYAEQFIASELNFPEEFSTRFTEEGCYVESGSESTCKIELIYTYNYYVEGVKNYQVNTYSKLKDVIVTDYFVDDVVDVYTQVGDLYLGVGEVKPFEFDGHVDINEYFWVSSDNSVVRVDNSNNVVAVSEGVANIRLVHKETLELLVDVIVHVENGYVTKHADVVLNHFNGNMVIDISNNVGAYNKELEPTQILEKYFKKYVEGTRLEYQTTICAEELNDCVLSFYDSSSYAYYTTNYFSVKFEGINIGLVNGVHSEFEDVSFIYLNKNLKLGNITNLEKVNVEDPDNEGQTIEVPADILIDYDSEYLELVDEDTFEFKTLKEGYTTITLYAGDSMTSVTICILFTEDEVNRATNLLANFTELEIPFSAEGISDKTAEDLIRGYLENELLNNDLYDYLVLNITLLPDNNFKLSATIEYDGYYLGILPIYNQFINGKFDEEGLNIYSEVEEIFSGVKDRYKLSLDQSIEAMANNKSVHELISYTGLDKVIPDTLDVVIMPLEEYYFNWYLNAGTMFAMELYYEEVLVGRKEFFVQLDLVLDRSVLEENDDASKLTYITSYIDSLNLGLTITKERDNYYKLVSASNRFYILFDQKDLIEAESVFFDALDIKMNVGESYKIRSYWYPFGSTHAAMKFVSSNPAVFTVDDNGLIVAKSKGFGLVRMSFGKDFKDMFVAVGYEDNEFFDEIITNFDLNLKITFEEYQVCGDIICVLYDKVSKQIDDYVNTLREPLGIVEGSGISTFAASTGEVGYEINPTDDGGWELIMQIGPFTSKAYPISYMFTGITMEDPEINLEIDETKEINISFSEGDKSNLRYYVQDTKVATISKGKVTGLKTGMTKVNVYDKYNHYSFEFTVFVNKDEYISYMNRKLDSTVIELIGTDLNGISVDFKTNVDYQIERKLLAAGIDLDTLFGSYDYLEAVINQDLTSAEISLHNYVDFDEERKFDIDIDVNGMYLPDPIVELNIGDTYEVPIHRYGEAATEDYTSVSVTPELCTINGAIVTALKSGICEVNYTVNNETIKQYFLISMEEFVTYLDGIVDSIGDSLTIQAEPYDINRYYNGDWEYVDLYNVPIRKALEEKLESYDRVYFSLNDSAINEDGFISFYLNYDKSVRFPYGSSSYGTNISSKMGSLEVMYHEPSDEKDGLIDNILEGVKTNYVLSTDQVLDVMINEGDIEYNSPYLFKYSDFEKDLKEACPDCYYYNNGCGATSPDNGIISSGINAIIFKGDEALVNMNILVRANINIDVYEIEDDGYIEESIKKHVRDAYRRYKDRHHASLYYRLRNNITEVTTENDYDVELKKLDNDFYTITIDDYTFSSYIHINILTKEEDFDYSVKVEEIKVNKDKVTITVGDTFDLVTTILPENAFNKNVIWSSADNSIATVVNGKVTAVKAGSTVITVKSEDGKAQTSINVLVNPLKVKEIKVNKEVLNMTAGDTFDLIAVVYPENASNKELKWSSTNTNVVTVDNGKVTAIGAGSAMIRVESVDGGMAVAAINVSVIELGLPGDIDADGKINIVDLIHLRKHLAGITVLTGDYYKRADFNKDGLVNIVDLVNMRKHLAA